MGTVDASVEPNGEMRVKTRGRGISCPGGSMAQVPVVSYSLLARGR